jgi:hypothetical protein
VVRFSTTASWKAASEDREVITNSDPVCGFPFEEGKEYLVYAGIYDYLSRSYTGKCQRTKAISDAAQDLAALGRPAETRLRWFQVKTLAVISMFVLVGTGALILRARRRRS